MNFPKYKYINILYEIEKIFKLFQYELFLQHILWS